jgi:phthiocerol/phenolphthiocerol synthesis type-I polyketide synthase E
VSAAQPDASDIAVIGMACRFPGARNIEEFWDVLRDGTEAITFFSEQELLDEGIPREVVQDPRYIPAKGILDAPDMFDAAFFGYSPKDAATVDPQQRLFLECAWEALEQAGIDPDQTADAIGVYAGSSAGTYLARSLRELAYLPDFMELVLGNDKDQLTTRTSYKLNLKGPSVSVQTACSTALVAVHLASQGLLSGDCDIAIAGGVSVMFPRCEGYMFREEGIYSRDGHCRALDAGATGTVPGDGAGLVLLKLATAALRDGDTVHALIKGTAINNDGAAKAGFTAPGIAGQTAVIRAAHQAAGVDPATISYVETHGTGTALGDLAELTGLTRAFRTRTQRTGFCAIGSVKSNIGHLNVAAGIAGLIKVILALQHEVIPPTLHFSGASPSVRMEDTPFYVNASAISWPASETPRRAGISSFGLGGTNAHVVLEEAPKEAPVLRPQPAPPAVGGPYLLLLSARTGSALERAAANMAAYLSGNPGADLGDVAYTSQVGRKSFEYRHFLVCQDAAEAINGLAGTGRKPLLARRCRSAARPVTFLLPGQGAQHVAMGAGLYETEPRFREEFDLCAEHVAAEAGIDLRALLFAGGDLTDPAQLAETHIAQPALFSVEYALARLWQEWGVEPQAFVGHSVGEYVAACLAGVFALKDALALVAKRGQLMQEAGPGAMLSIHMPETMLGELPDGVCVAAINAPDLCVVSGPEPPIIAMERALTSRGIAARRLHTARAFHSTMMTAAAGKLRALVARVPAQPPRIPFISNVTGTWITEGQATDPGYWAAHTLKPVRFADGLATLLSEGEHTLLEVGPGQTLSALARSALASSERAGQHAHAGTAVVSSMRHPLSSVADTVVLEEAAGRVWSAGTPIAWRKRRRAGRRVALPPYPFERQRYWHSLASSLPGQPSLGSPVAAEHALGTWRPEAGAAPAEPGEAVPAGLEGDVQATVAAIWTDLLGVLDIAADDDFFLLGGHSLLGTRLTARLREVFGVEVRLRDLFDMPTVAEQAQLVATLRQMGQGPRAASGDVEEGEL